MKLSTRIYKSIRSIILLTGWLLFAVLFLSGSTINWSFNAKKVVKTWKDKVIDGVKTVASIKEIMP